MIIMVPINLPLIILIIMIIVILITTYSFEHADDCYVAEKPVINKNKNKKETPNTHVC